MSYATALAYRLPGLIKSTTEGKNFGSGVVTYAISESRWQKLPEEVRKAMEDSGDEVTRDACAAFDLGVSTDIEALRKDGVEVTRMSDIDHAEIGKAMTTIADEWAGELEGRGKPGRAVLDAFRAVRKSN
jgi:TRAP-type C4-dicarboxylate transport system substrate-binding protein